MKKLFILLLLVGATQPRITLLFNYQEFPQKRYVPANEGQMPMIDGRPVSFDEWWDVITNSA